MTLYLASQSPRRREILQQIGVSFTTLSTAVDETAQPGETPADYVTRVALAKANAGWSQLAERGESAGSATVLGADTSVVLDQTILGKPRDAGHAAQMLRALSGRTHEVLSAVALVNGEQQAAALAVTQVQFRALDEATIARYWATGEPRDKAGGYGIQGLGAVLVERIEGSYSGVVGLPIETLVPLLERFAVQVWQTRLAGC